MPADRRTAHDATSPAGPHHGFDNRPRRGTGHRLRPLPPGNHRHGAPRTVQTEVTIGGCLRLCLVVHAKDLADGLLTYGAPPSYPNLTTHGLLLSDSRRDLLLSPCLRGAGQKADTSPATI